MQAALFSRVATQRSLCLFCCSACRLSRNAEDAETAATEEEETERSITGNINHNFIRFLLCCCCSLSLRCALLICIPFFSPLNSVPNVIWCLACGQIYILYLYVRTEEKTREREREGKMKDA